MRVAASCIGITIVSACRSDLAASRARGDSPIMHGIDDSPSVSPDAERFHLLIRLLKLGSLINAPMNEGVCHSAGISQIELKVVMALAGEGALAGHELVRIMGVPAMNVSRALASLRDLGLVEDATDPGNRRRKPVRLSHAGEAAYAAMLPDVAAVARALLGSLSARQRRDFAKTADVIIDALAGWGADRDES